VNLLSIVLILKLFLIFFSVPGGNDGPSGVLICSENYLTYKNFGDQQDIRCPIPRRKVCLIVDCAPSRFQYVICEVGKYFQY